MNMNMHQQLANSTVQIHCGNDRGTGFLFKNELTIITNYHVIERHINFQDKLLIVTESSFLENIGYPAELENFDEANDYAVLKIRTPLPGNPIPLLASSNTSASIGRKIIFSGYPHGLNNLLVHEAIISGKLSENSFFIDGMVNGGNSGGPIIDAASGELIGIVTQRRYFGKVAGDELRRKGAEIAATLSPHVSARIAGVDLPTLVRTVAAAIYHLPGMIELNSNSGIGVGFKIDQVNQSVI